MPDMSSGYSKEFRAANLARQIPLSPGVENLIKLALPDADHLSVLRYLVERGAQSCSAAEIAGVTCQPKAKVQAALEHFEKVQIARSSLGLLGRKYGLLREGSKGEAAQRLIKLWAHPQTHRSVMAVVLRNAPKQK